MQSLRRLQCFPSSTATTTEVVLHIVAMRYGGHGVHMLRGESFQGQIYLQFNRP